MFRYVFLLIEGGIPFVAGANKREKNKTINKSNQTKIELAEKFKNNKTKTETLTCLCRGMFPSPLG